MTLPDQESPWVFQRDEIDLLADEVEDLFEKFHSADELSDSFESDVLQEQLDTEEQSERELSGHLEFHRLDDALEWMRSPGSHACEVPSLAQQQMEMQQLCAHPLYQLAKGWAMGVKPHVKRSYERSDAHAADFFRVYANANLVPLKIAAALNEERYEDRVGAVSALAHYALAITYLDRVLESLQATEPLCGREPWLLQAYGQARELTAALRAHLDELRRRRTSL